MNGLNPASAGITGTGTISGATSVSISGLEGSFSLRSLSQLLTVFLHLCPDVDIRRFVRQTEQAQSSLGFDMSVVDKEEFGTWLRYEVEKELEKKFVGDLLSFLDYHRQRSLRFTYFYDLAQKSPIFKENDSFLLYLNNLKNNFTEISKFLFLLERSFKILENEDLYVIEESLTNLFTNLKLIFSLFKKNKIFIKIYEDLINLISRFFIKILKKNYKFEKEFFKISLEILTYFQNFLNTGNIISVNTDGERVITNFNEIRKLIPTSKNVLENLEKIFEKSLNILNVYLTHKELLIELKKLEISSDENYEKNLIDLIKSLDSSINPFKNIIIRDDSIKIFFNLFENFNSQLLELEKISLKLLNEIFNQIDFEQPEKIFKFLKNFRNNENLSEKFEQNLNEKFETILKQFIIKTNKIEEEFISNLENPPIPKRFPPLAGFLQWERSLFQKLKKPFLVFKKHFPNLESETVGVEVKHRYFEVAKLIRDEEIRRFEEWNSSSALKALSLLKQPIVKRVIHQVTDELSVSKYEVVFSKELQLIIEEGKMLDAKVPYPINETVSNCCLQHSKYISLKNEMEQFLAGYDTLIDSLSELELTLVANRLKVLDKKFSRFYQSETNWNSLSVYSLLKDLREDVKNFQSVITSLKRFLTDIDVSLTNIEGIALLSSRSVDATAENSNFTYTRDYFGNLIDIQEFAEQLQFESVENLNKILPYYNQISECLVKIENLLFGITSGSNSALLKLYSYSEKKVFDALVKCLKVSLKNLDKIFLAKRPSFKISTVFQPPDVIFSPNWSDFIKYSGRVLQVLFDCFRCIPRWMRNSCSPVRVFENEEEGYFKYSFYTDIVKTPIVKQFTEMFNVRLDGVLLKLKKFERQWYRYERVWSFNSTDISTSLKNRIEREVNFQALYHILNTYVKAEAEVLSMHDFIRCQFLLIDCSAIKDVISQLSKDIKMTICGIIHEHAQEQLNKVLGKHTMYKTKIENPVDNIASLKSLLKTLDSLSKENLIVEELIKEIEEYFHLLKYYNFGIADEELNHVQTLQATWESLLDLGKTVERSLSELKAKFTNETERRIDDFVVQLKSEREFFMTKGPDIHNDIFQNYKVYLAFKSDLITLNETREDLIYSIRLFSLPLKSFEDLSYINKNMNLLNHLFEFFEKFQRELEGYQSLTFKELSVEVFSDFLDRNFKVFKVEAKKKNFTNFKNFRLFSTMFKDYQKLIPILEILKSPSLRPRHFKMLSDLTKSTFDEDELTLQAIYSLSLFKYEKEISDISILANRELQIEISLRDINDHWSILDFKFSIYTKNDQIKGSVLKDIDQIQEILEDNLGVLQSLQGSKYISNFLNDVQKWERYLSSIDQLVDIWLKVQMKWIYLEAIYLDSEDIRSQLPKETKVFETVDQTFKQVMLEAEKEPNVLKNCLKPERLEVLTKLLKSLEECQKSLTNYLNSKRQLFPRFYFISDDELLSMLGTSEISDIQHHVIKICQGADHLIVPQGVKKIQGLMSSQKEELLFEEPILLQDNTSVEIWFTSVVKMMRQSLKRQTAVSLWDYLSTNDDQKKVIKWYEKTLGQVICSVSEIYFTFLIEDCFEQFKQGNKNVMKDLNNSLAAELTYVVDTMSTTKNKQLRKKLNTLTILKVHSKGILENFIRDSIIEVNDFAWESQLRFYFNNSTKIVEARQCNGVLPFDYEYMGIPSRLVITPLTDRCYMTLTQALELCLGGSPAGPAGTGKTETVKDLAKSLWRPFRVINASDGLDTTALGRTFSGLCSVGAFGCFDEFNRIKPEVLSVVSTQIRTIQRALRNRVDSFQFENVEIKLRNTVGIFITMNPGYAGRTELPDNLKAQFRPVVMVVPDLDLICEIMLYSEGFQTAKLLSRKMVVLYKLSKEQLSKQKHYDFGLRALKSVLVMAGKFKRNNPDNLPEELLLMRALRDANLPKFIYDDVPLFLGLVNDLFPNVRIPQQRYPDFVAAVEEQLTKSNYQVLEKQVDKIVQLYETMMTRHATMVVGPTCGGKSVVINTLSKAQTSMGLPTRLYVLNPKAQEVHELYGVLDPATRDWTDGLLSNIFRVINQPLPEGKNERRYIVFDGDVDTIWIESMNSVMDDNRLLTLPNNESINLKQYCSLLFEVSNLNYASPATVSRCGMVWVDPKDLRYEPFFQTWLSHLPEDYRPMVFDLFVRYVRKLIEWMFTGVWNGVYSEVPKTAIPSTDVNLIKQLTIMFDTFFDQFLAATENLDEKVSLESDVVESIFLFCLVWSIGALLEPDYRGQLDQHIKALSGRSLIKAAGGRVSVGDLPHSDADTLFDFVFVFDPLNVNECYWTHWNNKVSEYVPPKSGKFSEILVPNKETVCLSYLIQTMSPNSPFLVIGDSGTAKTVTIQKFLMDPALNDPDKTQLLQFNFSARTTSLDIQRTLEENIDSRSSNIYGPPYGKVLNVFLDDVNMPRIDIYGTQQPIALLKQILEYSGMYQRVESRSWMTLKDLRFISAMTSPKGGRNNVDERFVSHFCFINVLSSTGDSLRHIYDSILSHHLDAFPDEFQTLTKGIVQTQLDLYDYVVTSLSPTPAKFHYTFNLRDISRVFEGLLLSTPEKFGKPEGLLQLWMHEAMRIFHDKLIEESERKNIETKIKEYVSSNFDSFIYKKGDNQHRIDIESVIRNKELLYCDFMSIDEMGERMMPDLYEPVDSFDELKTVAAQYLETHNMKNKAHKLPIILFDECLRHLASLLRIIQMPRGNALLMGVGGSGKKTLTRFAAYIARMELFEITLSKNYDELQFREDLAAMFLRLGLENKKIVFLFTDAHVVDESFLEFINNLLTTGMVPALFPPEEKLKIIDGVRSEVKNLGLIDTKENCWNYFVNKCRDNLHIVLCFSFNKEVLRHRCQSFPGLLSNTVIDWYDSWSKEALFSVASAQLQSIDIDQKYLIDITDEICHLHEEVCAKAQDIFVSQKRSVFVSPSNFLDFLHLYISKCASLESEYKRSIERLDEGLSKISSARNEVGIMSEALVEKHKQIVQKQGENEELLKQIKEMQGITAEKQEIAQEKEKELHIEHERISIDKAEAEAALNAALPALEAAKDTLAGLSRQEIMEARALKAPTEQVRAVLATVALLMGHRDTSWSSIQSILANANLKLELENIDQTRFRHDNIKQIQKILKKADINEARLKTVSRAALKLWKFVSGNVHFYLTFRTVEPKQRAVREAEKRLSKLQSDLDLIKNEIRELKETTERLNAEFTIKKKEEKELAKIVADQEAQLEAAEELLGGLGDEEVRWAEKKEQLLVQTSEIPGNALLISLFMSYLAPFDLQYRAKLMKGCVDDLIRRGIPFSRPGTKTNTNSDWRIEAFESSDIEVSNWVAQGLPNDTFNVQNAIITLKSPKLGIGLIDPHLQASKFLKSYFGADGLKISSFENPKWQRDLENAMSFGIPFLFENIDEWLDPLLMSVFDSQSKNSNDIVFNDKVITLDVNFRIFFSCKIANPNFSSDIQTKLQLVNFNLSQDGLNEQLLNVTIQHEKRFLEEERLKLIQTISKNKQSLHDFEIMILRLLNNASGNLLKNYELIETLRGIKKNVREVTESLKTADKTRESIEKARMVYEPVSRRGTILFFALFNLNLISNMYEYSLASFLQVFKQSFTDAPAVGLSVLERLEAIQETVTYLIFEYACLGLFTTHKLLFAFSMCVQIFKEEIDPNLLSFFLKGNLSLSEIDVPNDIVELGYTTQQWKDITLLTTLSPVFIDLQVIVRSEEFLEWSKLQEPERIPAPGTYSELEGFEKLCLLRCVRHDRITQAVSLYIMSKMGERFVNPPVLTYQRVLNASDSISPVVFILSPGADPASEVEKLAFKAGLIQSGRYKSLSLGQGQDVIAEQMVRTGAQRGHWILLQNCHLLRSWLKRFEKLLEDVLVEGGDDKKGGVHKEFRLFLTTSPIKDFPLGILQRSVKVVTEPPNGLMPNILNNYARVSDETYDLSDHGRYHDLIYTVAFFHSVIQERKKYGKIGWNVSYEFTESDFMVSLTLLATYLNLAQQDNDGEIPWSTLRYLIGEAMYGGRVSDDWDRRILNCYLKEYMGEFLFDDFQTFHFYKDDDFAYVLPEAEKQKDYIGFVEKLPLFDKPALLGLHPNAEIQYNKDCTRSLFLNMIELQPREVSKGKGDSLDYAMRIITDILKALPDPFDIPLIRKENIDDVPTPTQIVLLQELERFNVLCTLIDKSLNELLRAMRGEVGMSIELDSILRALEAGQIPELWKKQAPPTRKALGGWIQHFHRRHKQYIEWIEEEPIVMWLSGLHVPESYLTALVQTTCRRNEWALDHTTLVSRILDVRDPSTIHQRPADGCYITGLYLEGAGWDMDTHQLRPQEHKELITEIPIVHIVPIEAHRARLEITNSFHTPVYFTSDRRNAMGEGLVFEAYLPTQEHESFWILQSVALVLNTS
ncbi:hypothetical protein PCE1_001553 [Barthelona sp. PCE]